MGSCSRKPSKALQKSSPPGMGQGCEVHRASLFGETARSVVTLGRAGGSQA